MRSCRRFRWGLLLVCVLTPFMGLAQDAIFSQHFATPLYMNPAFAGAGVDARLSFNYRNQPFPGFGTFSDLNFSYDAHVPALYGGIGMMLTSDYQGGLLMRNGISAVYAYHLQAADDLFVNFAAQAGYRRKDVMWDSNDFAEEGETPPDQSWRHGPDISAGVLLYSNLVYGGLAVHHLNTPGESLYSNETLPMKYTAHLGFYLQPGNRRRANTLAFDYMISPNIIFQQQAQFTRINYGLYAGVESVIAGLWFRHDLNHYNTVVFMLGMKFGNYQLGYSYDYSLSGFSDATNGAHEISISFLFHDPGRAMSRRILNCPAF